MPADTELIERLRAGDEASFSLLVDAYGGTMLHVARRYVKEYATAEEIVQETWLAVLQGLARFEGRSSLKSWVFAILVKRAMTRGKRDARSLPFSSFVNEELARSEPAVPANRFAGRQARWPRHWADDLAPWSELPEQQLLAAETRAVLENAIAELPLAQRTVVTLRDLAGQSAEEVAEQLNVSCGNVRVLLHRGRSKLRHVLESYFTGTGISDSATAGATHTVPHPVEQDATRNQTRAEQLRGIDVSWLKKWTVKIWLKWSPTISRMPWRKPNVPALMLTS